MLRIHRTAIEVAVKWDAFAGGKFVRDVGLHLIKHPALCGQIALPVGLVHFGSRQFVWHKGMPRLKCRAALSIINAHRKQREQHSDSHNRQPFGPFNYRPGRHVHS
ncbi:hypothetical protein D3C72_2276360 [compost metagenome]